MTIDPLSDVLALLPPNIAVAGGFDLGGRWSIGFDPHTGIKCYSVVSGGGWLLVDGCDAIRLEPDDCVLLPSGRAFCLTNDRTLPAVAFEAYPGLSWQVGMATLAGGGTVILGGHFAVGDRHIDLLLRDLPPVVHLRDARDRDASRWILDHLRRELAEPRPGSVLVAQHLAHLMLVQALRLLMTRSEGHRTGWIFALADPRLARAIGAIHADPGAAWSLTTLAARAGMSRTRFAQAFKQTVGRSPIDYLTTWRMLLAEARLEAGIESLATIAGSLGYASDSAFSAAFKRVTGRSPRAHARRDTPSPARHPWPTTAIGRMP